MNEFGSRKPPKPHEVGHMYGGPHYSGRGRISRELVESESTEDTYEALWQEVKAGREVGELPEELEQLPIEKLRATIGGKPIGLNERQQKEVIDETLDALNAYYASLLHSPKAAERTRATSAETLDTLSESSE